MLSVVIPVYNEEQALPSFLEHLATWRHAVGDVLFSDGGSTDSTHKLLASYSVVVGPKGRGGQCNRGAAAATGNGLLFLHADVRVDREAFGQIEKALAAGVNWGCLRLRWDRRTPIYRFGEWMSNLRAGVGGIPFGDQALFFNRRFFEEIGGFPDIPIMEDYELSRRLKTRGIRPRQLSARVYASSRRFEEGGPVRTALAMYRLRHWYRRGMSPERIAELYRDIRRGGSRG